MFNLLTSDGKKLRTSDIQNISTPPYTNVSFIVNEANILKAVPTDFTGLSINQNVSYNFILLAETTPSVVQLYRNLGACNVRIECGDYRMWYPDTAYTTFPPSAPYYYNKSFVDRMCAIFNSVNWSITWLINLHDNDPTMFSDMVGYIYSVYGSKLSGFEIGNEPDNYYYNGVRDPTYTYANYLSEWDAYETAIHAINPSIPLCGPVAGDETWINNFSHDRGSKVTFINHHKYPTSSVGTGSIAPTIENLLSSRLHTDTYEDLVHCAGYANAASLPIVMGETNCTGSGGTDNISNVYAATLWGIDYLFMNLKAGYSRVNFHGSYETATYYAPILVDGTPGPLYYSELLFHFAAPNGNLVSLTPLIYNAINVVGYSVVRADGSLAVIIVNKDLFTDANIKITTNNTYTHATATFMTAPSFTAKTGFTFGGSSVASDGTWTASTQSVVEIEGKNAWVKVPVGNAAVVIFS